MAGKVNVVWHLTGSLPMAQGLEKGNNHPPMFSKKNRSQLENWGKL